MGVFLYTYMQVVYVRVHAHYGMRICACANRTAYGRSFTSLIRLYDNIMY